MALHTTVGPASTTDLAIAERAGVTRRTFYRHFPDDVALFKACTGHTMDTWPPPDPSGWRQISGPTERLRVALRALYAFYRVAGRGLIVIMRDAPLLRPELRPIPSRADLLRAMTGVLLEGWGARGRQREVLRAVIGHVTSVDTWHSLIEQQGLTEQEAIDVLTSMVVEAATVPNRGAAPSRSQKAKVVLGDPAPHRRR